MDREFLLTIDVDWAADWMVADIADVLVARRMPATWFVTHESPVLRDLASEPLFEIGLHPNFLPSSSHGAGMREVMDHMKSLVPSAVTVRTHCLFQSERHSRALVEDFGIETDCSILLLGATHVQPHGIRYSANGPELVRVPHVFQDNMFLFTARPITLSDPWFDSPGLKVFDFHPVHLALNSASPAPYESLKASVKSLSTATRKDVADRRSQGDGMRTLFDEFVARNATGAATIRDYVADWRARAGGDHPKAHARPE